MGAVLREQNALPYEAWIMKNLTAKDDVDNVGAGRDAKGANPGRSAGSLFRRFAPYCLDQNYGETLRLALIFIFVYN